MGILCCVALHQLHCLVANGKKMSVCYYDLETTGLGQGVEIISIGATASNGPWAFQVFIQPDGPIHPNATRVHGMYKDQYGRLTDRNDRIVSTAYVERPGFQSGFAGLEMFLHWLHQAECRFLVAHNNSRFDAIVLNQNLAKHQLNLKGWFNSTVNAIDSMTFVKTHFPGMRSYSLPNCMHEICNRGPLQHHDALSDAKDVQALCEEGARRLQYRS